MYIKSWLDIGSKIAIAVVGAFVGYYFNLYKQQNEDVKLITEFVTSGDKTRQAMGQALFRDYSSNGRLPDSFVIAMGRFANSSTDTALTENVNRAIESAVMVQQFSQDNVQTALADVPARVYFHVSTQGDKAPARRIETALEREGAVEGFRIIVPSIEIRQGPNENQLRCFRKAECADLGERIKSALQALGVAISLKDLSGRYEDSTRIRPNHFEVWFAPDGLGSG